MRLSANNLIRLRISDRNLNGVHFLHPIICCGKSGNRFRLAIVNTLKTLSRTDRPVDRTSGNPQHRLDIIKQFKSILCLPVHFIDKRKNRNMAHHTDFK